MSGPLDEALQAVQSYIEDPNRVIKHATRHSVSQYSTMSIRQYAVIQAMNGLLANASHTGPNSIAIVAIQVADRVLQEEEWTRHA
jgi:hypothetical protein